MENFVQGKSKAMKELMARAERVAGSEVPVLLLGETGTGKNRLAEYIHYRSGRRNGLLLRLDCAEFSRTLVESELFGHERGAFTGATEKKCGLLELVCGGTLFLDEIENLDEELQNKLLHVIDPKEFRRVGGRQVLATDFRVISATNVELERLVRSGVFRRDLYYRLKGVELKLPALRERPEDIPLFVHHFLKEFGNRYKRAFGISEEAMSCLEAYSWPGNVRELRHVLEALVATADGEVIGPEHLPFDVRADSLLARASKEGPFTLSSMENRYIRLVLALTRGCKREAARVLGISRNTLKRKLKEYRIDDRSGT